MCSLNTNNSGKNAVLVVISSMRHLSGSMELDEPEQHCRDGRFSIEQPFASCRPQPAGHRGDKQTKTAAADEKSTFIILLKNKLTPGPPSNLKSALNDQTANAAMRRK